MSIFAMLMIGLFATATITLSGIAVVALCIFIFKLVLKGATTIPSVIFAFVLGARFDNIFLNIIGFGLAFILTKRLMQYTRIKNAIVITVAMVSSMLALILPQRIVALLLERNLPFLWVVLSLIFTGFVATVVLTAEENKWNEGNVILERLIASFLYMVGLFIGVGSVVLYGEAANNIFLIVVFLVLSFVGTYVADVKLTKDWVHIKKQLLQYPIVRTITVLAKRIIRESRTSA